MKKLSVLILIALPLWLLSACKGHIQGDDDTSADADSTAALTDTNTKIGTPMEKTDIEFAIAAASGGIAEITLGKLAQQRGKDIRVKNFGAMMVKDHSIVNDKLMAIMKNQHIALPAMPDADDQKVINELESKSGKSFDKAYIKKMVEDHQKDLKAFTYASKNCSDPALKRFATKALPVLNNHMDAINSVHYIVVEK